MEIIRGGNLSFTNKTQLIQRKGVRQVQQCDLSSESVLHAVNRTYIRPLTQKRSLLFIFFINTEYPPHPGSPKPRRYKEESLSHCTDVSQDIPTM